MILPAKATTSSSSNNLVRAHDLRELATLLAGPNIILESRASDSEFAYNPRNFDILGRATMSGQSLDYHVEPGHVYDLELLERVVEAFRHKKDFNDKLLKSEIFPKRKE